MEPKKLGECFNYDATDSEVYTTENRRRQYRQQKGRYSRNRESFDFITLLQNWEDIVGKLLGQNTLPLKLKGNTLYIATKHSIFAGQMALMSPMIIQKIGEFYPSLSQGLKKIKYINSERLFSKKADQKHKTKSQNSHNTLHPYSPLYQQRTQMANDLFNDLEDKELSDIFTRLLLQKDPNEL